MASVPKSAEGRQDTNPRGSTQRTTAETSARGSKAAARPPARDAASNVLSEGSQLNPAGNDLMEGGSLLSEGGKDSTTVETAQPDSQPDSQPNSDDKGSGTQNHENDGDDEEENRGDLETGGTPSQARDGTKRHLWTSTDDAALAEAMRSTGMGTFYVKGKYLPVGEVDWDLVTETFNQNTRSSKFSKKQVKDRWEQHKRPGLLKHKSLPKAARQKIIAFLHEHIGTSQYEARGRRLIRWIDLTMDLWEIGVTCSTSTTKNVWNSHQSKVVRGDAPMPHGSRPFDNQSQMVNQYEHQLPMASGSKRPSSAMDEQSSFSMREDPMNRHYPGYPYPEGNAMPDVHHHGGGSYPRQSPRHFPPGHREGLSAAEGQPPHWDERRSHHAQSQHASGGMGQYKPHGPRYADAPFPGSRPYFNPQEQRAHPGRPYPESSSQMMHYRSYGSFPEGGARSSWQGSAPAFHGPPPAFSRHPGQHSGRFSYGPATRASGPAEPPSTPGQQRQQQQSAFQRPVANGSDAAQAKQSSGDNYNAWWRGYMI